MQKIQIRILEIFGALLVGVPFCVFMSNFLFEENEFCDERRFSFLNPFYDLFFDGYHDDPNGFFYILLLLLGYGISKLFIFALRKIFQF
jgi:hypothetical protein